MAAPLTAPEVPAVVADAGGVASPAQTEQILASVMAELVSLDQVPVDGNFFDELGADSMVMARFCARVRKVPGLPPVSMKDIYENPTISGLARALAPQPGPAAPPEPTPAFAAATGEIPVPARTRDRVLCGTLQLLAFVVYSTLALAVTVRGFLWISLGSGATGIYLRAVAINAAAFTVASVVPIVAKWVLIGRWKAEPIRIWSFRYYRFWLVKTLIRSNPVVRLNGRSATSSSSPLYTWYLRALGARIGRGVTILSANVPVCTDLLTIGDNTVVRKDSFINCYRARSGVIEPGPVTLGRNVLVGEATVLDIGTAVEDGGQLGHASSLEAGQTVPANTSYQGVPARPTYVHHRTVGPGRGARRRRFVYALLQLVAAVALTVPVTATVIVLVARRVPVLATIVITDTPPESWRALVVNAMAVSAVVLVGGIVVGLAVVGTIPRLLRPLVKPGVDHPLYGIRYVAHRLIARLTNVQFFTILFGDSSFIVHYLRWIGYDLSPVDQTGSNFGTHVKHETPFLVSVGTGTVVADGLSAMNAEFSSSSFRLSPVTIGANNFLGNNIAYPSGGMTGDDCLLATKVAVPISGEWREGVGVLGSPSFQIPRTVSRDRDLEIQHNEELFRPLLLTAKNRHNLATMGLYLLLRWLFVVGSVVVIAAVLHNHGSYGPLATVAGVIVSPVYAIGYWVLVQRAVNRLQALEPEGCSIYHRTFWRHERYWKLPAYRYVQLYNGTPFKPVLWRLLGVRVGANVFDDGCFIAEKSFTTIGDNCTLNAGSVIQCHSQEDGGFKSDRTTVGSDCVLGAGSFVHYGVTMGPGSSLATDCFLMKGQDVPPGTTWVGNPAQEARA
ncbi:MAG: Pls/PosA family non-ribosomal peptide synthetase [Acidimicrobiales bacterium]